MRGSLLHREIAVKEYWSGADSYVRVLFFLRLQDVVNQGKGGIPRDTESGQLLIDRATHLDVLEYLLWINRWGPRQI